MMRKLAAGMVLLLVVFAACSDTVSPTPSVFTPTIPLPVSATATAPAPVTPDPDDAYAATRELMVTTTIESRGISDPRVLHAMRTVPRHRFVPDDLLDMAYADRPLPIGYGQTISQPYIVAWMTELLELEPGDRVLEIGTGSGYQSAILAAMPEIEIYTIEIVAELADIAEARMAELGYSSIHCRHADGYFGWPEHAPFDGIIVTAAPDHLPQPLVEQLAPGGRIVIPIGPPGSYQTLWQFVKQEDGELRAYSQGGVIFVPFTGEGIETGRGGQGGVAP